MLLENPRKASTSEPDQMAIFLNSLDSEPKPECMRNTSVTSYLQMMQPLQFALRKTFSGFWTAFQKLIDILDLTSALGINTDSWEVIATDRDAWRQTVKVGLSQYEETHQLKAEEKGFIKRMHA